jgi:hypothetical protein
VSALEGLLDELAERLAVRVAARLKAPDPNMISQEGSPLGARRHCAAVRRRVARAQPGAAIVGRRYLLSPEALSEELGLRGRPSSTPTSDADRVRAELDRELRLVKRGGRG